MVFEFSRESIAAKTAQTEKVGPSIDVSFPLRKKPTSTATAIKLDLERLSPDAPICDLLRHIRSGPWPTSTGNVSDLTFKVEELRAQGSVSYGLASGPSFNAGDQPTRRTRKQAKIDPHMSVINPRSRKIKPPKGVIFDNDDDAEEWFVIKTHYPTNQSIKWSVPGNIIFFIQSINQSSDRYRATFFPSSNQSINQVIDTRLHSFLHWINQSINQVINTVQHSFLFLDISFIHFHVALSNNLRFYTNEISPFVSKSFAAFSKKKQRRENTAKETNIWLVWRKKITYNCRRHFEANASFSALPDAQNNRKKTNYLHRSMCRIQLAKTRTLI